jgi:hypothetical protein
VGWSVTLKQLARRKGAARGAERKAVEGGGGCAIEAARHCEAICTRERQPAWRLDSKRVSGSLPGTTSRRRASLS